VAIRKIKIPDLTVEDTAETEMKATPTIVIGAHPNITEETAGVKIEIILIMEVKEVKTRGDVTSTIDRTSKEEIMIGIPVSEGEIMDPDIMSGGGKVIMTETGGIKLRTK
jgi:hypothetical protein